MGNFRQGGRDGFDRGSRSGGSRFGGRSRDRDSGRGYQRMHEVTCDKCGKECQVPFRPTGNKPIYCSACFGQGGNSNNFNSRNQDKTFKSNQSGVTQDQFKQINAKLDKIIQFLEEIGTEEEFDEDEDDEDSDDS